MENNIKNQPIMSLKANRLLIGILAISFPVIVILAKLIFEGQFYTDHSLSYYRLTSAKIFYLVILNALAYFLILYRGYESRDNILSLLSAISIILIAWVPVANESDRLSTFHIICKNLFYTISSINFWFFFTKTAFPERISIEKQIRNNLYKFCALLIWISFIGTLATRIFLKYSVETSPIGFYSDILFFVSIGFAWLVKSGMIIQDKNPFLKTKLNEEEDNELTQKLSEIDRQLKRNPESTILWAERARTSGELGRLSDQRAALERYEELERKEQFEQNLGVELLIKELQLSNLHFFGSLTWKLNPHMNILLGKNGYGKTHLVSIIVSLLQNNLDVAKKCFGQDLSPSADAVLTILRENEEKHVEYNTIGFTKKVGKVPVLAISELRFIDKSKETISDKDEGFELTKLNSEGAWHFLERKPLQPFLGNVLKDLCLTYLETRNFKHPKFALLQNVLGSLTDNQFKIVSIDRIRSTNDFQFLVQTNDNANPIPIQRASQGTLSILSIVMLIYNYIQALYLKLDADKVQKQPAIVFIDELDAHLHPSWQKKIVSILRDNFPNVQFILTAHSPLVVAGCFENEISVLRRDDKNFFIELYEENFIGIKTKDIYLKLFETNELDDNFFRYATMASLSQNDDRINELTQKKDKSEDDLEELSDIHQENLHLLEAKERYDEMNNNDDQLTIRKLKAEIRELEDRLNHKNKEDLL